MDENDLITRLPDDFIPAKPLIEAARYLQSVLMVEKCLGGSLSPSDKFSLLVLSHAYNYSKGTENTLPDDVCEFIHKLRTVREINWKTAGAVGSATIHAPCPENVPREEG